MYFSKELMTNSVNAKNYGAQWTEVAQRRNFFNANERQLAAMAGNAAAVIPQDVYREFDKQTKDLMRADEGDNLLNDLLPLARAVNIGKIEYQFRRASDSGNAITTLSGQTPVSLDKTQYSYDKAIIPIHQDAFGRAWRELEGQRSEGFDALIDDQANSVRAVRRKMVDYILDGSSVVFNGTSWTGIRNDNRVAAVDLGVGGLNIDFTSPSATADDIRAAWISLIDTLRIDNNVSQRLTFYVSRSIMSNFQRYFSTNDAVFGTIKDALMKLEGVADIKETSKLSGNEVIAMGLSSELIRPLVGMGVNTVAVPRQNPFDMHNYITWGAMGIQIVTDYDNRTGVLYAAS